MAVKVKSPSGKGARQRFDRCLQNTPSAPAYQAQMLTHALEYEKLGLAVIPIRPGKDKKPYIEWKQYQERRATPDEIETWWRKWPNANIGIVTGNISGLVVIDIDGPIGLEAYKATFGEIPATISQHSGREEGGLHLFFRHPGDSGGYQNSTSVLCEKVDVRGDGGYVIVAPSIHHSGKKYEWVMIDPVEMGLDDLLDLPKEIKTFLQEFQNHNVTGNTKNPKGWTSEALRGVERGRRNDTCAKLAGKYLRMFSGDLDQAGLMLKSWNERNIPPLEEREVRKTLESVARLYAEETKDEEKDNSKEEKKTQSQILCEIAENIETFCTPDSDVYAFIPVNGHLECWPVRWKIFKQWLVKRFFDWFEKPPGGQALSDALNVIEAKARFSGAPKRETFLRVAEHGGKVYLDLCNEIWQVVEISAAGWQIIDISPVPFKRPPGLLPLPEPGQGDKAVFKTLKKYINLKSENDFILLIAWLVGALRQEGDHVILVLQGPEGTGKTTAERVIKSILDPNISSERSAPRNEEDFIIGASNNHITSFDNISGIQPWLSDALCRLSTGGGLATRRLYTNDEEKLFYARRPVILTGINPMPNRNDLARRCIVLNLEPIQGQVLEEKTLFERFRKEVLPGVLGAVCDAVSAALRNEQMKPKNLPCMASFTAWVLRAEEALPWELGAFREAYKENTQNIIELAVDTDLVSSAIQKFMTGKESWEGTASELLEELCKIEIVPEKTQKQKAWPQAANVLSNKLRRQAGFLRQVGITVETGIRVPHSRKRLIRLSTKKIVPIVTSSPDENNSLKTQEKMGDDKRKKIVPRQVTETIEENKQNDDGDDGDDKIPTLTKDDFETELPSEPEQEVVDLW